MADGFITITLASLPADNGSAITETYYSLDGGSHVAMGLTAPGSLEVGGLVPGQSYDVTVYAESANGKSLVSDTKQVAAEGTLPTAPAQFASGQWSLSDAGSGGTLNVSVNALPDNGGSGILAIEYRIGAGVWTASGRNTPGTFQIGSLVDGSSYSIEIRAINIIGNGLASTAKSATPTTVAPSTATIRVGVDEPDGKGSYDSLYTLAWTDGTYPLGGAGGQVVVTNGIGVFSGTRTPGQYTCGNREVLVSVNDWAVATNAELNTYPGKNSYDLVIRKGTQGLFSHAAGSWGSQSDFGGAVWRCDGPDVRGSWLEDPAADAEAHFTAVRLRRCQNLTIEGAHIRDPNNGTGVFLDANYGGTPAMENIHLKRLAVKPVQVVAFQNWPGQSFPSGCHGIYAELNMEIRGLSITDCHIHGAGYGIRVPHGAYATEIVGNHVDSCYEDFLQSQSRAAGVWLQAGNYFTRPISNWQADGYASPAVGPHSDGTQLLGANDDPLVNHVVFEADYMNEWFHAGSGYQAKFLSNYSGTAGVHVVWRLLGHMDKAQRSFDNDAALNNHVYKCGGFPHPDTALPATDWCARLNFNDYGGTVIEDSFVGAATGVGGVTVTNSVLDLANRSAAALTAALPAYPAVSGPLPTKSAFMDMFQPAPGGILDGKGPYGFVTLAPGAELSEYVITDPAITNPVLSGVSPVGGAGTFTGTWGTDNTDGMPLYWCLTPTNETFNDYNDIKFRRNNTIIEAGIAWANPAQTTGIGFNAPTGIPAGTYKLSYFQENGYKRRSGIGEATVTIT